MPEAAGAGRGGSGLKLLSQPKSACPENRHCPIRRYPEEAELAVDIRDLDQSLKQHEDRQGAVRYLRAFRQQWSLIVLSVVATVGVTAVLTFTAPKKYQATADVQVTPDLVERSNLPGLQGIQAVPRRVLCGRGRGAFDERARRPPADIRRARQPGRTSRSARLHSRRSTSSRRRRARARRDRPPTRRTPLRESSSSSEPRSSRASSRTGSTTSTSRSLPSRSANGSETSSTPLSSKTWRIFSGTRASPIPPSTRRRPLRLLRRRRHPGRS